MWAATIASAGSSGLTAAPLAEHIPRWAAVAVIGNSIAWATAVAGAAPGPYRPTAAPLAERIPRRAAVSIIGNSIAWATAVAGATSVPRTAVVSAGLATTLARAPCPWRRTTVVEVVATDLTWRAATVASAYLPSRTLARLSILLAIFVDTGLLTLAVNINTAFAPGATATVNTFCKAQFITRGGLPFTPAAAHACTLTHARVTARAKNERVP